MPKKSKLKAALDVHQGKDHALERQRKLEKAARQKKKKTNAHLHRDSEEIEEGDEAEIFGSEGEEVDESLQATMKKIISNGASGPGSDSESEGDEFPSVS